MANSSALLKTLLHKAVAEGIYKEILSRESSYYYFLGKTLSWADENNPPYPIDDYAYERDTRNNIITMKKIQPNDIALVAARIDWTSGNVYDIYDDQYSTQVLGINISDGGTNYLTPPVVTIDPPDLAGGAQATGNAVIYNTQVIGVELTNNGSGYTNPPAVSFYDSTGSGSGARAVGTIGVSSTGVFTLQDAQFYVVTDEYNVYKCLDNNNGAQSTVKPIGTQVLPIPLSDGYVWKYLFNIPIALRTKFLTDNYFPVVTALSQQFYSNGGVNFINILNEGSGYTNASISVAGDGYLPEDPVYLTGTTITVGGHSYSDGDTVSVAQPIPTTAFWTSGGNVYLGTNILESTLGNIYTVTKAGILSSSIPTHKIGSADNGTASLKYVGSIAQAYPTISGGVVTAINLIGGVREVNMSSFGSGYTTNPTVTFTPPKITFNGSSAVNTSSEVITLGSHWFSTGDTVLYSNGGGTTIGGLVNNTVYYIIKASSTTVKLASSLSNANAGTAINLTSAGSGTQSLSNNTRLPVATTVLSPFGSVKQIIVNDSGDNYTTPPTITIGSLWTASTAVTLGQQFNAGGRLYTVTTSGTTGSSAPTGVVIGVAETNGTAGLTYVGSAATATCSLRYGAGYGANPAITINTTTGSGFSGAFESIKSEAKVLPILDNGNLIGTQIDNAGAAYTSATLTVSGDGTGAVIQADLSLGNITTLQANSELLTVPSVISNIQMTSNGYGYGSASVTIWGDGTGATAQAVITGGKISKINIINQGSGYTYANIIIDGNGFGASARAIISPYYGHGRDTQTDLFTRALMVYSNVSRDKVQGFDVNNDYRQVGIIKEPRNWAVTDRFTGNIGTPAYVIACSVDTTQFKPDMIVTTSRIIDGYTADRRFLIVSVNASGTSMLVLSLDNVDPQLGDSMKNDNNQIFGVAGVELPTVDKYTGSMLFVDNKAGFTPSADETVTLRTIITF